MERHGDDPRSGGFAPRGDGGGAAFRRVRERVSADRLCGCSGIGRNRAAPAGADVSAGHQVFGSHPVDRNDAWLASGAAARGANRRNPGRAEGLGRLRLRGAASVLHQPRRRAGLCRHGLRRSGRQRGASSRTWRRLRPELRRAGLTPRSGGRARARLGRRRLERRRHGRGRPGRPGPPHRRPSPASSRRVRTQRRRIVVRGHADRSTGDIPAGGARRGPDGRRARAGAPGGALAGRGARPREARRRQRLPTADSRTRRERRSRTPTGETHR